MSKGTQLLTKRDGEVDWYLFDADGQILGRLASEIAKVIRGKHKVTYTPHVDAGGGVIIINAEKVKVTGYKEARKVYSRYTGFMGGLRQTTLGDMRQRKPEELLRLAVKGMVPNTKQCRAQLKRLRIFAGTEHGMTNQQPTT